MIQDSRGYLWMGTRGGGITRFDGMTFTTFTNKNGLSNNAINCIKEDAQKNIWIGTNDGLSFYNGREFKNYYLTKNKAVAIIEIDFDAKQNIWIASSEGLLQFHHHHHFENISATIKDKQHAVNSVLCSRNGNIYYANANGFFTLKRNKNNYVVSLNKKYTQINCIREDKQQTIWLGTYGMGVWVGNGIEFMPLSELPILKNSVVWNINFDKKNNAWLSTLNNGVIEYNVQNKQINILSEQEGLGNNHVRCMLEDQSGNFWFGTSGGGVSNYFGKLFTHYDKSNGLGGNFIYSIFKDHENKTWIGIANKGLTILDSSVFYTMNASNGFADVKVKAIAEDNFGTKYFGTDGDGLYILQDNHFEQIEKLNKQYIRSIVKDKEGNIWVATSGNGIYKITPSHYSKGNNLIISNFNVSNGIWQNRITTLICDAENRIWYGTENSGVGCIGSEINIRTKDGLPSDNIRCLLEDKKNTLWIGTAGDGIAYMSLLDSNYRIHPMDNEKLTSTNIYLMACDSKNNLLLGSESGIDNVLLDKDRQITYVKHYSKGDGFLGIETCQNAVCDNGDGTFWFGTINGLTKYNPFNLVKNANETITTITDVRLFYISLSNTKYNQVVGDWNQVKNIDLPYSKNHLSFDFIGINFSNPDAVKYKWQLENFDPVWSPESKQRTVTYSNIPPGDYVFKVISCNEDGVWNKTATTIQIHIRKPFWMEWWFMISGCIILFGLIWFIFKQREKSIKQKASEQQQKIILEKDLIELEHKALRLQMNPHFIFNALNSIQSQIGTDDGQNARYYLAKFSKLMRQILDNSRNSLITLQDEISMLENYLLVEKFCNNNSFDYAIHVQEDLEVDYIKIPPMILQPFVENAIKHGMKYLVNKTGFIEVSFTVKDNMLLCSVSDNGIGRKKAEELNKKSRDNFHKSTALVVTQERLNLLHQQKNESHIHIIDLYDESGEALGTKVDVEIPIK